MERKTCRHMRGGGTTNAPKAGHPAQEAPDSAIIPEEKRALANKGPVKGLKPQADQTAANQLCSMRTYSKSTGWLLMPTRGGAIQLAYSPGWWQAFMSEWMKS